jgi:hypothetical protein
MLIHKLHLVKANLLLFPVLIVNFDSTRHQEGTDKTVERRAK